VLWMFNIVSPLVWRFIPFFAQNDFFQNPSQSLRLSMYVAQSSSTSTTPSRSHRSNNSMHCYIDGEAFKSIIWTKFETSYFDVFSAYNLNISWRLPCLCLCCHFDCVFVHYSSSSMFVDNFHSQYLPQIKLVVECQLLLYFIHFHCAQQLMTIL